MTDDLVQRLRDWVPAEGPPEGRTAPDAVADMRQASDRIKALAAENERLLVSNEQWQVDYNEAVIDKLELETKIKRLRGIGLHLVQHINWVTNGLPDLLEDACLTDEEGVINAAIAAATEARAALEKQP